MNETCLSLKVVRFYRVLTLEKCAQIGPHTVLYGMHTKYNWFLVHIHYCPHNAMHKGNEEATHSCDSKKKRSFKS